ncbi:hypothetical protein F443_01913 [Plasmopara halstedii]|uniref:RING-type domain-containing protein n=1 Tax=Plasmopara halstedii TaxID=4781 RepID=A0A0P1A677_PLAHL|nr:hypothetical protein F443_01913 [Plasmopara halstedii]CEG35719.1 hypothetical protein F443_01913 [Plasmopara halstedii]|eukprot:XP_024572088.1 hypothetical protein F443_01913 [Plasmopara halstedii]
MNTKRLRKKRSLPVGLLPPQVAWLDGISMGVTSLVSRPRNSHRVDYLLTVVCESHDLAESSTWHLVRTFDEFRYFRKRLTAILRRGHFCHAECPWLFTFLKSYYPKSQLVGGTLSKVVNRRQKTLTRSLATIRSFLMKRSNHVCPLVMQGVALELLEFIVGGQQEVDFDRHGNVPEWLRQHLQKWHNGDFDLEISTNFDKTESVNPGIKTDICAVCNHPLDGLNQKEREAAVEGDRWSQIAAVESSSVLLCGQNFHDGCLSNRHNEFLACPTCGREKATAG